MKEGGDDGRKEDGSRLRKMAEREERWRERIERCHTGNTHSFHESLSFDDLYTTRDPHLPTRLLLDKGLDNDELEESM